MAGLAIAAQANAMEGITCKAFLYRRVQALTKSASYQRRLFREGKLTNGASHPLDAFDR